jgi:hypothetical protein
MISFDWMDANLTYQLLNAADAAIDGGRLREVARRFRPFAGMACLHSGDQEESS